MILYIMQRHVCVLLEICVPLLLLLWKKTSSFYKAAILIFLQIPCSQNATGHHCVQAVSIKKLNYLSHDTSAAF